MRHYRCIGFCGVKLSVTFVGDVGRSGFVMTFKLLVVGLDCLLFDEKILLLILLILVIHT